jgi:hypothetical protein
MPKLELPKIEVPTIDLKKIDLPDIPPVAAKPIYAGVGATDLAYETARGYVNDVQKTVKGFKAPEPKTLQDKAQAKLAELRADAKALPGKVQARVEENRKVVNSTYAELAKRGEVVLTKLRKGEGTAKSTLAKKGAPAKNAPAKKAAPKKSTATKKTTARKTTAAKKTTTAKKA